MREFVSSSDGHVYMFKCVDDNYHINIYKLSGKTVMKKFSSKILRIN